MENKNNEAESISLRLQEQNEVLMKIYGKLRLLQRSEESEDTLIGKEEIDEAGE